MISHLFSQTPFEDRFSKNADRAVDVIIPIIHTNEMWDANLRSIYREIPVKRLLISDGGCIDDSLDVLKKYPRVEIFDHKKYVSLGYCLKKLMEEVKTERFIYLHSDVYLPEGWFDQMWQSGSQYDWCESKHINTFLLDIPADYSKYNRALSGGQIGKTASFAKVLPKIDDDYLYRNEDIIFAELIKETGAKYGRSEALLYHEIMNKRSQWRRTIMKLDISVDKSREEEIREYDMQARGLIKYLPPNDQSKPGTLASIQKLIELNHLDLEKFKEWVKTTPYGDQWLKVIDSKSYSLRVEAHMLLIRLSETYRQIKKMIRLLFA